VHYLDIFWTAPPDRGAFPRCGANPWCGNEDVLAGLGLIQVVPKSGTRGVVKMGGLFTDSTASFLEQKMGRSIELYLPSWWEKPRPVVFFSIKEDDERNDKITELWSRFTWKIDVAEPTSLSKFLDEHPGFGNRFDELIIRVYDEEVAQDWIDLFNRLGREATKLGTVRIYWDQLSRDTNGADANILSRDENVLVSLASIKVNYGMEMVGKYAPLCVWVLEEKTGMVGRQMPNGNHELKHRLD
jgi:hypothetical protein